MPSTSGNLGGAPPPRRIRFRINGQNFTVNPEIPPWTRLVDFLREHAKFAGTKALCREGGCGVCTVVATVPNVQDDSTPFKTFSVHSCQTLVYSCNGWNIETIEHLGNRYKGYHSLQKALDGFYGTQCGYCSPGMIMAMYGQLKSTGSLTTSQVEQSLDGNLCRCTGYRPILDAFKSLAQDANQNLKERLADIEDAYKARCHKTGDICKGFCGDKKNGESPCNGNKNSDTNSVGKDAMQDLLLTSDCKDDLELQAGGVQWYQPFTVEGILNILKRIDPASNIRMVVGNTGQGVYKKDGPYDVYINIGGIKELHQISTASPITLGANVNLGKAIDIFNSASQDTQGYQHLRYIAKHWKYVANVSVRNIGSWAGNLMLKHKHHEFPSDIFLTLLACDAQLVLRNADSNSTTRVNLEQFLNTDMTKTIILSVILPPMDSDIQIRTYKITPRAVNAHAYVNACIKMKLDPANGFKVIEKPAILFGGINPQFIHASQTESFLTGKQLTDDTVLSNAINILSTEIEPDSQPQDATPKYRKSLAQGLLFKTVVDFLGDAVSADVRSGGPILTRPLSSGQQDFDLNQDSWPVGKGIPKVESAIQISGEAVYMDDIAALPNEAHGALVLSEYANARIASIDATAALNLPGVLAFIKASDILGVNTYVAMAARHHDPVFASERVAYAGQAVGMIVAEKRDIAVRAAKLVTVQYDDIKTPVLSIEDALACDEKEGRVKIATDYMTGAAKVYTLGDPESALRDAKHKVTGEFSQGSQFHLTMEAIAGRVVPIEDGYDVFATTQWPTETQAVVAMVLDVPVNSINISVRRIGGGYGGKISRNNVVVAAAAVAARKLTRPVRLVLDLNTHMQIAGWRERFLSKYEAGFDDEGKLSGLNIEMICDGGHISNETSVGGLAGPIQNCYYIPNLVFRPVNVNTDTAANTWCRTPGTVQAIATVENVMERIATYLGRDSEQIRMTNMSPPNVQRLKVPPYTRNVVAEDIIPLLKEKAYYVQRKEAIEVFNRENRWKKKGISIVPMWYPYNYPGMFRYGIQVIIYEHDGTVAVSHGGIEMGQGINTKVAQIVAHTLNVPLELVIVKATDAVVGANSMVTGGSFGSDLCAHGAKVACEALKTRMDVVREEMMKGEKPEPTWLELVKKCNSKDLDLCERYWTAGKEHPESYNIWGACCLEVEIDILTGQYLFNRADIIEDCGKSLNPYVDIGQVEGAFVMGLGFYTSELVKFDPDSGKRLSNGTWEYKPPTALDIPVDLRVTLLPNAQNPHGVLGSKATGEPALCLSFVVVTALRDAVKAFREENGNTDWFDMDTPLTVEKIHELCGITAEQYRLHTSVNGIKKHNIAPNPKHKINGARSNGAVSV